MLFPSNYQGTLRISCMQREKNKRQRNKSQADDSKKQQTMLRNEGGIDKTDRNSRICHSRQSNTGNSIHQATKK
jgi:hypothetical protein